MKVKQLIKELQKMPQNAEVYSSAHDNEEWEVQSESSFVQLHKKKDYIKQVYENNHNYNGFDFDSERLEYMPSQWVTIHG